MKTKDGYKVASGMLITKGAVPFEEHAIIVDKVDDDSITYTEAEWDEAAQGYYPTGDGGLMFADEVAEYEFM